MPDKPANVDVFSEFNEIIDAAPVDFLGRGSDRKLADKQETDWQNRVQKFRTNLAATAREIAELREERERLNADLANMLSKIVYYQDSLCRDSRPRSLPDGQVVQEVSPASVVAVLEERDRLSTELATLRSTTIPAESVEVVRDCLVGAKERIDRVLAQTYTDDNVLYRHKVTTTACEPLLNLCEFRSQINAVLSLLPSETETGGAV